MSLPNLDKVVGVQQIQLNEAGLSLEGFKNTTEKWQGVPFLYGNIVEVAVINALVEWTIFLADKEESCPYWGRRGVNYASHKVIINIFLHDLTFWLGQFIEMTGRKWCSWEEADGIILRMVQWPEFCWTPPPGHGIWLGPRKGHGAL